MSERTVSHDDGAAQEIAGSDMLVVNDDLQLMPLTSCNPDEYVSQYMANHAALIASGQSYDGVRERDVHSSLSWVQQDIVDGTTRGYGIVACGGLVGEVTISSLNADPDIEYWLTAGEQGKGIARQSVATAANYVFDRCGVDSLTFRIKPENEASRRLAEGVGAVQETTNSSGYELWRLYR